MSRIESNVYLIKNLRDLNCNYWLYKVRGLSPNLEDYQKNIRFLTRRLTRATNSTCAPLRTKDGVFIAQPDSEKSLPSSIDLVRTTVKLEREPNPRQLNFDQLDDITASLALRFLYGRIGTYKIISNREAFICNTGPPFKYRGTTKPLHILKEGPMPIETVLEDVFYLACLTWTKIDDCSRLPISIKMNDIRLREIAGEYSADALKFDE